MILDKSQIIFFQKYEVMINSIVDKFIEDYKDAILEVPKEERDITIELIKKFKEVKGLIKELNSDVKSKDFTGI